MTDKIYIEYSTEDINDKPSVRSIKGITTGKSGFLQQINAIREYQKTMNMLNTN